MCGKSWSTWRFTYHYAWACPGFIETPPPIYINKARRRSIESQIKSTEERDREGLESQIKSTEERDSEGLKSQIKSTEERDSEGLEGRSSRSRLKSRERDSEEFSAAPILELRFQTKFSLEPKVRSKAETTDYFFFSAKKPKGNNCLPYTCLICHISEQTNKFVKPFSFLSSPLYSTHFVNTYIIDKDNSLEKFESVVFFFLCICEL